MGGCLFCKVQYRFKQETKKEKKKMCLTPSITIHTFSEIGSHGAVGWSRTSPPGTSSISYSVSALPFFSVQPIRLLSANADLDVNYYGNSRTFKAFSSGLVVLIYLCFIYFVSYNVLP